LKHEFDDISWRFNEYKRREQAWTGDLESKIFNETHTSEVLNKEKSHLRQLLHEPGTGLINENHDLARQINKRQMFSTKDEQEKQRREDEKKRNTRIGKLNDEIIRLDTLVHSERARLEDDNLIDKQKQENMTYMSEYSKIEIDMNIAWSRI